jgi:hypothetical protein
MLDGSVDDLKFLNFPRVDDMEAVSRSTSSSIGETGSCCDGSLVGSFCAGIRNGKSLLKLGC